jgi:general secretion pathway protein K
MRTRLHARPRGIALIIVMLVIVVLSTLAAGFAYSMKVETRLARNVTSEPDMLWCARSGVELARYVLALQLACPEEPFDALMQRWAGGPGGACATDGPLAEIPLQDVALGPGRISVKITDLESKININLASRDLLQRALELMPTVDALKASQIIDSIEDWKDPNDAPQLNGAERDFYLSGPDPYIAKNGPIDDLEELLLIRGIREDTQIYWGPTNVTGGAMLSPVPSISRLSPLSAPAPIGLVNLFNTLSRPQVNVNTASADVLQLLPGMDRNLALGVIQLRAGMDGVDGTEDDTPLRNPGELINVRGMMPEQVQALQRFCGVRSFTFEVHVAVTVGRYRKTYVALLYRNSPRDVQVLDSYWQ